MRGLNTLPAHLCASALLGKIIYSAVPADEQQEETDIFELADLEHTGEAWIQYKNYRELKNEPVVMNIKRLRYMSCY